MYRWACLWWCHALAADSALCVQPSCRATRWRRSTTRWSRSSRSSRVPSSGFSPRRSYEDGRSSSSFWRTSRPADVPSPTPRPPLAPSATQRPTRVQFSFFSFLFLPDKTSCLGFLTSRAKHTGSLMTSHSTRYSSLMFKGGEL